MKKFKIYFLISTIMWLGAYVAISIGYLTHGATYFPSVGSQIFLFILGVNFGVGAIIILIRQIKKS